MKRAAFAGLALLASAAVPAELPSAWAHWQYWRQVEIGPAETPRLVKVGLPVELYGRAHAALADLRLIDEGGLEVPYVLRVRREERSRREHEVALLEISFVPGSHTLAVVDAGADASLHNALDIETEEKDFFARVEVAISDDAREWRVIRDREPIYRFEDPDLPGRCRVSYPQTRSRFVRLRVLEGSRPLKLRRCLAAYEVTEPAEIAPLPARFYLQEAPPGRTWWQADLGAARVPACGVRLETTRSAFHRRVEVYASEGGREWTRAGEGEILRSSDPFAGADAWSSLLPFDEHRGRHWRVVVVDGNDPPLEDLRVGLMGIPRHVVFRQEPRRSYRLLYGNSRATEPGYEMAQLTDRKLMDAALTAGLGVEAVNTSYADPSPWSERHPGVLWAALAVALGVLGTLAISSLRQAR